MGKIKKLQKLDPDYILTDYPSLLGHLRSKVTPAYSPEEISAQKEAWYVLCKFADENNLTKRQLVEKIDDIEKLIVRVKDYTSEGLRLLRLGEDKYLRAIDRGVQPDKAIKTLEQDLQKIKMGKSFVGDWEEGE